VVAQVIGQAINDEQAVRQNDTSSVVDDAVMPSNGIGMQRCLWVIFES